MRLPDIKAPEGAGSKNYLKIKDKESVRGVIVGEMHHFYVKWLNGKSLPAEMSDSEAKVRFKCNFATTDETGSLSMKIWEFPYTIFEQLKAINEDYPLDATKIKITRSGTGTETTYQIIPLVTAKDTLTNQQALAIKGLPVHALDKKMQPPGASDARDSFKGIDPDEIPF